MNFITRSRPPRSTRGTLLFAGGALALLVGFGSTVSMEPSNRSVPTQGQSCQLVATAGPYDLSDVPDAVAQTYVGRSRFEPGSDVCTATVASTTAEMPFVEQSGSGPYDLSDVPDATTENQAGRSRFQPRAEGDSTTISPAAWWAPATDMSPTGPYDLSDIPDAPLGAAGHAPFRSVSAAP